MIRFDDNIPNNVYEKINAGMYDVRILFGNLGIDRWDNQLTDLTKKNQNMMKLLDEAFCKRPDEFTLLMRKNKGEGLTKTISFVDESGTYDANDDIMNFQCGPNPLFQKYFNEVNSLIKEKFAEYHLLAFSELCANTISSLTDQRTSHLVEYSFPPTAMADIINSYEPDISKAKEKFSKVKGMFSKIGRVPESDVSITIGHTNHRCTYDNGDTVSNYHKFLSENDNAINSLYDNMAWDKLVPQHTITLKTVAYNHFATQKFIDVITSVMMGNNFVTEVKEEDDDQFIKIRTFKERRSMKEGNYMNELSLPVYSRFNSSSSRSYDTDINTFMCCYGNAQFMMMYPEIDTLNLVYNPLPSIFVINVHNKFHSKSELCAFARRVCSLEYKNILISGDFNVSTEFRGETKQITDTECDELFTENMLFRKLDTDVLYQFNNCKKKKQHMRVYYKMTNYVVWFDNRKILDDVFMLPASVHVLVPLLVRPHANTIAMCIKKNNEFIAMFKNLHDNTKQQVNANSSNIVLALEHLKLASAYEEHVKQLEKIF